jgi:hypothetical protein
MKTIVVGGHSRNIGKTSLVAGIVAGLRQMEWTAVKITQYGHGICSVSNEPCACAVEDPDCPYAISEEKDGSGRSDSSRFLAAGARRALWVRTRMGRLELAMPALRQALTGSEHVIIESNSVLAFLKPDLYLVILDPAVADFKESARHFLDRADAFVLLDDGPPPLPGKPVFRAPRGEYLTPEVVAFVAQHLTSRMLT